MAALGIALYIIVGSLMQLADRYPDPPWVHSDIERQSLRSVSVKMDTVLDLQRRVVAKADSILRRMDADQKKIDRANVELEKMIKSLPK